ncbi:hypothetical protein ACF09C_11225 [Streptomyces sp. NPDC014870]|uniref:hypothetical protein n=1 Tax=Streptomyces sp. NPDC014870 TaxID=3364925 RepID=UPI0036FB24F0
MRMRVLAAAGVLAGTVLTSTMVAPAQATGTGTTGTAGASAGWVMSIGGPIRTCDAARCDVVYQTSYGEDVYWTTSRVNSAGNRWYKVTSPASGWIYCMNISAPC